AFSMMDMPSVGDVYVQVYSADGNDPMDVTILVTSIEILNDGDGYPMVVPSQWANQYIMFDQDDHYDSSLSFYTDAGSKVDAVVCFGFPPMLEDDTGDCITYTIEGADTDDMFINYESNMFVAGDIFVGFYQNDVEEGVTFGVTMHQNERLDLDVVSSFNVQADDAKFFDLKYPAIDEYTDLYFSATGDAAAHVCVSFTKDHPIDGGVSNCDMTFDTPGLGHINLPQTGNQWSYLYMSFLWTGEPGDPAIVSVLPSLVIREAADQEIVFGVDFVGEEQYFKYILSAAATNEFYTLTMQPDLHGFTQTPTWFYDIAAEAYVSTTDDNPLVNKRT
ncbi:hypothetical protein KIPB_013415, partial [Kipferlia bialata]